MMDIQQAAKNITQKYFSKSYPHQPAIDMENIRVQIENFEWNGAAYRIDVFFLHQKPSFLPYHQNFWMSHRIWMTKNGNAVKQEPVYTSNAVHPELNSKAHENLMGLFPGNYYYKKELDFIDDALKKKKSPFLMRSGPEGLVRHRFHFPNGISDMERIQANIIQLANGYSIIFEGEKYYHPKETDLFKIDLHFILTNEGEFSEIKSSNRFIPGLC